jgi:DnaJ-class molecular chaperone
VKPSTVFRRQGTTLYHDAKVPLHTALLGGRVRIPTLEGDVEVRVREGTQNGEEAVLKGRGIKSVYGHRGGERGDLVVGWKIQIPRYPNSISFTRPILMQQIPFRAPEKDPPGFRRRFRGQKSRGSLWSPSNRSRGRAQIPLARGSNPNANAKRR